MGYDAVTIYKLINAKGAIHVVLLTSKSWLTHLKQVTILRLELCAAVLALNLDYTIKGGHYKT